MGILILLLCIWTQTQHKFKILLSAFWGPAAVMVILALSGMQIYFVTCIFASILVGLAGDNAIQYIMNSEGENLSEKTQGLSSASILVTLLMMILPASFMLSYFNPMRTLGLLFALGTACSLFGDYWILKGLLEKDQTH